MSNLKPNDNAPEWKKEAWWSRASKCVLMLSVHGFLSHAEAQRAYQRISKWEDEHLRDQAAEAVAKAEGETI